MGTSEQIFNQFPDQLTGACACSSTESTSQVESWCTAAKEEQSGACLRRNARVFDKIGLGAR